MRPEVVATGLQSTWALAFLPQDRFLVTERRGRMRVVESNGRLLYVLTDSPRGRLLRLRPN